MGAHLRAGAAAGRRAALLGLPRARGPPRPAERGRLAGGGGMRRGRHRGWLAAVLCRRSGHQHREMHYTRENGTGHMWKWVYPGAYDPAASFGGYRQQGIASQNIAAGGTDSWDPTSPAYAAPSPDILLGQQDTISSYPNLAPPVQIANNDFGGPYAQQSTGNQFPFGGFARNGDMLEIPFIGAYRLTSGTSLTSLVEMNAVTTDCSYSRTGSPTDRLAQTATIDSYENLGRFCPMTGMSNATGTYVGSTATPDYYDWTGRLYSYFSTWTPGDDYFPNVDPSPVDSTVTPTAANSYHYPGGSATVPYAVSNAGGTAEDSRVVATAGDEDLLPTEGLINLNTASAEVLSALPWTPIDPAKPNAPMDRLTFDKTTGKITAGADGIPDNIEIAQLIVNWRDAPLGSGFATPGGPFTSIADLNKVAATNSAVGAPLTFANCFGLLGTVTTPPTAPLSFVLFGDITPTAGTTPDGVVGDFEKNSLMLNRVSNLVTVRSDTYTVYVLVQGWQNVGTKTPTLAVQRRAAIIVDRTAMSPSNGAVTTTNIPSD